MDIYAWAVRKLPADSNCNACYQSGNATRERHHAIAIFQLVTEGGILTGEEPILVYDNPGLIAMQRCSLLEARFKEDGRLNMPVAGFDDDTNARRRAAERKGKQLLAFRDTVEVIGWGYIIT